jgi:hypothetical protein
VDGGPEAEFVVEVLAGVDPVGGLDANGLGPCRGDIGLLRTGDEDGVEGDDEGGKLRSSARLWGAWGAQAPH